MAGPTQRITALDQFRGYTVAGMFLVNYLGYFAATPPLLKHHNTWCSYADTIMPQFFFAVGFAMRLVFLKNSQREGMGVALRKAAQRCLFLILLGGLVYGPVQPTWQRWLQRDFFQALVHIGFTGLWLLPVIGRSARTLALFAAASGLLHLLLSYQFWYAYLWQIKVIDGGALGFLSWTLPTATGALAYDFLRTRQPEAGIRPFLQWGAGLMAVGYGLSCLTHGGTLAAPPFSPPWHFTATHGQDLFTMSQRAGSISYLTFSAGFSLALFAVFLWANQLRRWELGLFRTLGTNALAGYVLHDYVADFVRGSFPKTTAFPAAFGSFLLFFAVTYGVLRFMEHKGWYWRL